MFHDESARSNRPEIQKIKYYIFLITLIMAGIFAFLTLTLINEDMMFIQILQIIFYLAIAVSCWYMKDYMIIEYDYSLMENTFTVAKIINNKRRKEMQSFDLENMQKLGKIEDEEYKRYESMPDVIKVKAYLNKESDIYYAYFIKSNQKHLLLFEPSDKLITMMGKFNKTRTY